MHRRLAGLSWLLTVKDWLGYGWKDRNILPVL
jgi:hypothetical protein